MAIAKKGKSIKALAYSLTLCRLLCDKFKKSPVMMIRSSNTTVSMALASLDLYGFEMAKTKKTPSPA